MDSSAQRTWSKLRKQNYFEIRTDYPFHAQYRLPSPARHCPLASAKKRQLKITQNLSK